MWIQSSSQTLDNWYTVTYSHKIAFSCQSKTLSSVLSIACSGPSQVHSVSFIKPCQSQLLAEIHSSDINFIVLLEAQGFIWSWNRKLLLSTSLNCRKAIVRTVWLQNKTTQMRTKSEWATVYFGHWNNQSSWHLCNSFSHSLSLSRADSLRHQAFWRSLMALWEPHAHLNREPMFALLGQVCYAVDL